MAFNKKFSDLEMIKQYGQEVFLAAEAINRIGKAEKKALKNLSRLSKKGLVKLMKRTSCRGWYLVVRVVPQFLQPVDSLELMFLPHMMLKGCLLAYVLVDKRVLSLF